MKIKFSGYIDTESRLLVIEKLCRPGKSGRPSTEPKRLAALIMAEAWARTNFTRKKLNKEDRIASALPKGFSEGGSQRRAIRDAKKLEGELFAPPDGPGMLVYGNVGAVWFCDRATHYPDVIVGRAWVWTPGMNEAIFTIAKAEPEGSLKR